MSKSESSEDETLDVTSDKFDPLKAIYSSKIKIPFPNAKSFDNVAQYISVSERISGKKPVKSMEDSNEPKPSTSKDEPPVPVRRFEKYLTALTTEAPPRPVKKSPRNVLTRMASCSPPFTRLWECVQADPPSRVRVVTRHGHGIRGTLDGYVVAFDKHFNLAMRDVTEIWYRTAPSRKKTPFWGDAVAIPPEGRDVKITADEETLVRELSALAVSHRRQKLPRIPTRYRDLPQGEQPIAYLTKEGGIKDRPLLETSRGGLGDNRGDRQGRRARLDLSAWRPLPTVYWRPHGKRQECERHIDQLFVRGEHVVFIQFPPKLD